jgi:hypothetical protein
MAHVLDQLRKAEADSLRTAREQYRALLLRADAPQPNDASNLHAVCSTLGKTSRDVVQDLGQMEEFGQAPTAEAINHANAEVAATDKAMREARREVKEAAARLNAAKEAAHAAWIAACGAVAQLQKHSDHFDKAKNAQVANPHLLKSEVFDAAGKACDRSELIVRVRNARAGGAVTPWNSMQPEFVGPEYLANG